MKDFETVSKLKKKIEGLLMSDERVVSVGTVKEVDSSGKETDSFSIQIGLISEASPKTTNDIRQQIKAFLEDDDEASAQSDHANDVQVVFSEEGEIQALARTDIPSADDFTSSNGGVHAERSRPLVGGISLSHYKGGTGTLGAIVSFDPPNNQAYILSNNHVLANLNSANVGDPILQPGAGDSGQNSSNIVAQLTHFHPMSFSSEPNQVDAAIAEVNDGVPVKYSVKAVGTPQIATNAKINMQVEKSGRKTGHTFGKVVSIDETTKVKMGHGVSAVFTVSQKWRSQSRKTLV